jgi:TctA family transporter
MPGLAPISAKLSLTGVFSAALSIMTGLAPGIHVGTFDAGRRKGSRRFQLSRLEF